MKYPIDTSAIQKLTNLVEKGKVTLGEEKLKMKLLMS